ncbi:MAG TPA: C40 family peptidase [Rhodanobacteraceae bacterium]|nr:C40 family peptidase [Rhodanobacteraceae bacterium]
MRRDRLRIAAFALTALLAACSRHPTRPEPPPVAGTPRADAANAVLFRAIALVGTPYRYGGNTPDSGFDCSGLVGYVFRDAAGVALPRTSSEMSDLDLRRLDREDLQAGDVVFFADGRRVSHVGIYVGEGRFVHAPNRGGTVRLDRLDGAWWSEHFVYGKRVLDRTSGIARVEG